MKLTKTVGKFRKIINIHSDAAFQAKAKQRCRTKYASDAAFKAKAIQRIRTKYASDAAFQAKAKQRFRTKYASDAAFKAKAIQRIRTKYASDAAFKAKAIQRIRTKYASDAAFKAKAIQRIRTKYASDAAFKAKAKQRFRTKYASDAAFKAKAIQRIRTKYASDAAFKAKAIQRIRTKYASDAAFKAKAIQRIRTKYASDAAFKAKAIQRIRTKYASDTGFKAKAIQRIRTKYASDTGFKAKAIQRIRTKYNQDVTFKLKMRTQAKARSRTKYASDERAKQIKKFYTKNRYHQLYKFDNVIRQRQICKQKNKYRRNPAFRESVIEATRHRYILKKTPHLTECVKRFRKQIRSGPEFICVSCHRHLYRENVIKYNDNLIAKLNSQLRLNMIKFMPKAHNSIHYMCITCKNHLRKGKLPQQAAINGLLLDAVPKELAQLTDLEAILIAQRIFFMKILALPRGKQLGINGSIVNVSIDVQTTSHVLPRPPSQLGLIPLKLKRKLSYKGHVHHQFIRPHLIHQALQWLVVNNPLYKQIEIADNWNNGGSTEDQQIIDSLCGQDESDKDKPAGQEKQPSQNDDDVENSDADDNDNPEQEMTGIKYSSCLQPAVPQYADMNELFSIAPGEGNTPLDAMLDKDSEKLAHPSKFPLGRGSFSDARETFISIKKYTNQRLLNCDKRFSSDTSYLFYAQFITEQKQIRDNISIALRKITGTVTAADVSSAEDIRKHISTDQAYQVLKSVRGTPPYWQKAVKDLMAMVKQLGSPQFFLTLSAADLQWPELLTLLLKQKGVNDVTDEMIENLSYEDKCQLLRDDPIMTARQFQYRLRKFFTTVLMSPNGPLGEIETYFYRIEFQMRGSPHAHCLIWIKNGPNVDSAPIPQLVNFFSKYISVSIPDPEDDKLLNNLVPHLQKHKHSVTCKKNKKDICRFHFPKPPSNENIISAPPEDETIDPEILAKMYRRKEVLLKPVLDAITNNTYDSDMTLECLLQSLGVNIDEYHKYLALGIKARSYIVERKPNETNINNYNPTILKAWQANMDLQPVLDTYACIMYIVSYVTKSERSMGELLRAAKKDSENLDIKIQLKKIGSTFLTHREVSAQEAVYRVLGLPMLACNVKRIFVPSDLPEDRVRLLKPLAILRELDPDSTDIYVKGLPEKFAARPNSLNNMCFADFSVSYSPSYETISEHTDDTLPPQQIDSRKRLPRIVLKHKMGTMTKRSRRAILRYHKHSPEKEPEKHYHSLIMLFFPWRNEALDIKSNCETYEQSYNLKKDVILGNKSKFEHFSDEMQQQMVRMLNEQAAPESAWDRVAAEVQHEQELSILEGSVPDPHFGILYPENFENLVQSSQESHSAPSAASFDVGPRLNLESDAKFSEMVQSLNKEQRYIFQFVLDWCCQSAVMPTPPFHLFVSGPGGTGKSHLIFTLVQMINRVLKKAGDNPADVVVQLSAPTGTAAYNIRGYTLHHCFLLPLTQSDKHVSLSSEKLAQLRNKYSKLQVLIIDEISMVSANQLGLIHARLQAITCRPSNIPFGGVSIIAVGDLQQLPPVGGRAVFSAPYGDDCTSLADLWNSNFKVAELTEIMRQKGDDKFAQMLSRIRVGKMTNSDIEVLKSREITQAADIHHEFLHLFPTNKEVDEYNDELLETLSTPMRQFSAADRLPDNYPGLTIPQSDIRAGGLPTKLFVKLGCRVMLIRNVDVENGLVNGAQGTITGFQEDATSSQPKAIFILFDDADTQTWALRTYPHLNKSVPIETFEARFPIAQRKGNKSVEACRVQFPLKVAYANTIHKCQGQTHDNIVVSMEGRFGPGQAYVALSRCRSLQGLNILKFDPSSIKTNRKSIQALEQLSRANPLTVPHSAFLSFKGVRVCSLNCRSWNHHSKDVIADPYIQNAQIAVFTETWLPRNAEVSIPQMQTINCSPDGPHHSGVLIAVSDELPCRVILKLIDPQLQIVAISVLMPYLFFVSEITLIALYRSPSLNTNRFYAILQEHVVPLIESSESSSPILLLGDFNVNLLDEKCQKPPLPCAQFIKTFTHKSGSLLDHIYWTGDKSQISTEVIGCYWSDHNIVAASIGCSTSEDDVPIQANSDRTFSHESQTCFTTSATEFQANERMSEEQTAAPFSTSVPSFTITPPEPRKKDRFPTTSTPTIYPSSTKKHQAPQPPSKEFSAQTSIPITSSKTSYPSSTRKHKAPKTHHADDTTFCAELNVIMGDKVQITFPVSVDDLLLQVHLRVVNAQPDGHCLMHSWQITTGTDIAHIKIALLFEYLANIAEYIPAGIELQELERYIADNKYDLPSVDAVVNILSNAYDKTVFIVHDSDTTETDVLKITSRGQNLGGHIYLLKTGAHYDALVRSNS